YQTVITHELGHGIGLEHSPDSGSVMYGTLNSGVIRRGFTAYDLSNLAAGGLTSNDSDHNLTAAGPVTSASNPSFENPSTPSSQLFAGPTVAIPSLAVLAAPSSSQSSSLAMPAPASLTAATAEPPTVGRGARLQAGQAGQALANRRALTTLI